MLAGRPPTKDEKEYMNRVGMLGCIVCWQLWDIYCPNEIHHMRGKTAPGCHFWILGLCANHHRHVDPGDYVARSDGKKAFEEAYGTEEELLEIQNVMLEL